VTDVLAALWSTHPGLLVAAVAVAVAVAAVVAHRIRRWGPIRVAVAVAVSIGIGTSIEGMYALAVGPLHLRGAWVLVPAVLFESAAVATGARAQRHAAREHHAGRYGTAVWLFAAAAGVVTALNGHSPAECVFRLVAPLVGTAVWYQGLVDGGARPSRVTWTVTPRRIGIRLGLVEPGDTDVVEIHREHRVAALTVTAHRVHSSRRWRRFHVSRLRRLALAADDAMVAEAQSRVARVHRIEALTAPVPVAEVPPPDGGDVPAEPAATSGAELPPGRSARTPGRKRTGSSARRRPEVRKRRTAEETRTLAAQITRERPGITRAELAGLLAIGDRQLRNVLRDDPAPEAPANGADVAHLIPSSGGTP
jgi:hypothetical protein